MRVLSLALILSAPAVPAFAQQVPLPQGCEAWLTMQSNVCTVDHIFTCEGDAEGSNRRVTLDAGGVTYFGQINRETEWVESTYTRSGHSERLEDDPADRASFTELLEIGANAFDFVMLSDEVGDTRYVGADLLTGETAEIDGVELLRTEYVIRAENAAGDVMWEGTGQEYIHPEWRIFIAGTTQTQADGETYEDDRTPREFIFPGEPGFASRNPKYNCGVTESSFAPLFDAPIQGDSQ